MMMGSCITATVMHLFLTGSGVYGDHFCKYGKAYNIDPLLAVAVAYHESKLRSLMVSQTNDYGLMQLHVSKTTNAKFIGKEHLLFDPIINIQVGIQMLAWWKRYHKHYCRSTNHHWLNHYNHGKKIISSGKHKNYAKRVLKVYYQLTKIRRFVLGYINVS